MTTTPQRPEGRNGVLTTLDASTQVLNLAKDPCGIPLAQIALGSAGILLTMILVRFPLLSEDKPLTHFYLGHHDQLSGLRRP
jgi:hypothetical protein